MVNTLPICFMEPRIVLGLYISLVPLRFRALGFPNQFNSGFITILMHSSLSFLKVL
jgi:hypothetical protein